MENKKKSWKNWLVESTKLVGFNPASFEEKWSVNYSRFQLISLIFLSLIVTFSLAYVLLSYTFFTSLLPSSVRDKSRNEVMRVHEQVLELDRQVNLQDQFIKNLQSVILGSISVDSVYYEADLKSDDLKIDSVKTKAESLLEATVMTRKTELIRSQPSFPSELFLLEPLVGTVSQKFNPSQGHLGIDVVTKENEPVLAPLKGVVVFSAFSEEDGWVLILNHPNEIVTVYKHCNKILRTVGDQIRPGDPIALVGNTGASSSGAHLHFELWSANSAVDPLKYLSFK
jgi:murein DD-endopeptidase MepM/ murein hydrolase activator NlpD